MDVIALLLQEVEALIAENDSLQRKLHSQEDDFRLQNSTLMEELSKVSYSVWYTLMKETVFYWQW